MKKDLELKFITPCFCAGADQGKAEIRAATIRGILRWWFRILGGSQEQEREVFGGLGKTPVSSSVIIRIDRLTKESPFDEAPRPNQPLYYLSHFAKDRFKDDSYFSPNSSFTCYISLRRAISSTEDELLKKTILAFEVLGAIGLRSSRGFGSFYSNRSFKTYDEFNKCASKFASKELFIGRIESKVGQPLFCEDWKECLHVLESLLRTLRSRKGFSAGKNGEKPGPLGRAKPRQRSGLILRPVKLADGYLPVVYFTEKILDTESKKSLNLDRHQFKHPFLINPNQKFERLTLVKF